MSCAPPAGAAMSVMDMQNELSRRSGRSVTLFLTDNRRRMASVRRRAGGALEVRLQRIFLRAPEEVVAELARLAAGADCDRGLIRGFVENALRAGSAPDGVPDGTAGRRPPRRASAEREAGAHHDLGEYARRLNDLYLGGRSTARVLWGRRGARPGRRSIRFACYDADRNIVIMNRKLDRPDVPAYFVEYVLFHEMLHEVLGVGERADGRRDIHGRLFRLMESTYPDFEKALRYEEALCRNLGAL